MLIDLNVRIPTHESIHFFIEMACKLGLTGLAIPFKLETPVIRTDSGLTLFQRTNLSGNTVPAIKKQLRQVRHHSIIVAAPFKSIEISNWAAEDAKVDLLTFDVLSNEDTLRESTARLAAASDTFLEIPVFSLLNSNGLDRSRIIKSLREACRIAFDAGMKVVLSSGSTEPINMRSSVALQHIGLLLGMDLHYWKKSVYEIPNQIVERNQEKMNSNYVARGVEIVRGDEQE